MRGLSIIDVDHKAVAKLNAEALTLNGVLKVMPSEFYRQFRQDDLCGFCMFNGFYCLPTFELLDYINEFIAEVSPTRHAIEIGSGNGILGRGLGIPCTDNLMQTRPEIIAHYARIGQPVIKYGEHVEKLDALKALKVYAPDVVVAAWVTHTYDPLEPERGGNMYGVDEKAVLKQIKRYVYVGNATTHELKPLLKIPHREIRGDFLFSRGRVAEDNMLLVWDNPEPM